MATKDHLTSRSRTGRHDPVLGQQRASGSRAERDGHAATGESAAGHDHADHAAMLRRWIWRDFANVFLGFWLMASAPALGIREPAMLWSDRLTGAAIVVLGLLALFPRFEHVRWGLCFAGIWLLFAPLVLWTGSPGAYANDTLVGMLVITFSVLVPMMPGRTHHAVMTGPGPDTPPGWSYNPSDWMQRGPIIAMAFVGMFLSRYLAAYQLGHVEWPWDPFFGDGTKRVLESDVSKAFPISDAGLGAVSYAIEALSGFMGGRNRWRTMPWMVLMFGILVVPLGVVSIVLVILQPISVGAWCTLCLVTSAAMLVMVAPAIDEVVAMGQFLAGAKREGKPLWRTFWVGGTLDSYPESEKAARSEIASREAASAPEREAQREAQSERRRGGASAQQPKSLSEQIVGALDLNSVPWNLVLAAALGVWLMAAPAVLGVARPAASSEQLAGALVVTFAVIAWGEIVRPLRFILLPIGLWVAIAPWVLGGHTATSQWIDVAVGAALMALSLGRGRIEERFGGWNRYLV